MTTNGRSACFIWSINKNRNKIYKFIGSSCVCNVLPTNLFKLSAKQIKQFILKV